MIIEQCTSYKLSNRELSDSVSFHPPGDRLSSTDQLKANSKVQYSVVRNKLWSPLESLKTPEPSLLMTKF